MKPYYRILYNKWYNMKIRCYGNRVKDKYYKLNHIVVCEDWLNDFNKFYNWAIANGYKDGLSLERIDNGGDYTPENCTFIPLEEQSQNKNNNKYICYHGKKYTCSRVSKALHHGKNTILQRYNHDWNHVDIVEKRGGDKLNLYPYQADLLLESYTKNKVAYYYDMGLIQWVKVYSEQLKVYR